jgi:hypothetical protein
MKWEFKLNDEIIIFTRPGFPYRKANFQEGADAAIAY